MKNYLSLEVKEWACFNFYSSQQLDDLFLDLSNEIYTFVRLMAFFLHCISFSYLSELHLDYFRIFLLMLFYSYYANIKQYVSF
ncbi:MAG: hypothetical protein ACK5NI_02330, partial [bacterium]